MIWCRNISHAGRCEKGERELRECWSTRDGTACATCVRVPWPLRPDQRSLARPVVHVAKADQGVAPVIVMLAVPQTDRRRYITKKDLAKYGYTVECQACTQLASGMHNAKVPHDDRCRDRIGEFMAEDDDQRQKRAGIVTNNPRGCSARSWRGN